MKELTLNGTGWTTKDDFYNAFFEAVGAPEWHGRNLDALNDSIANGAINEIEVPYRIVIENYDKISGKAKEMVGDFIDLVHVLAVEGCPVEIRATPSERGSKSSRIRLSRLKELEADFEKLLIPVLEECANGRWGLFGQNDPGDGSKYVDWPAADELKNCAKQIQTLREELGQSNSLAEQFLNCCSLRGANVTGEPKLARALLGKVRSGKLDSES
jgi:ribonuclease inhibitor